MSQVNEQDGDDGEDTSGSNGASEGDSDGDGDDSSSVEGQEGDGEQTPPMLLKQNVIDLIQNVELQEFKFDDGKNSNH
jgi:hypothetical protein